MSKPYRNIILIGMAGSGKSSIGRRLAAALTWDFIDTDDLIEREAGYPLQKIIEIDGLAGFRMLEEKILLGLSPVNHVIATGGSSIYSQKGMQHLKKIGLVVFLDVDLRLLETRIKNFANRGLVKPPEQSFKELYMERLPLYRQHADLVYACGEMNEQEICDGLVRLIWKG